MPSLSRSPFPEAVGPKAREIFDEEGGALLQELTFDTKCTKPIKLGDTFGSVTLSPVALQIGRIVAHDPNAGVDEGVIYSIEGGGADADFFEIDEDTGELRFREDLAAPDFEDPRDVGLDNTCEVTVRARNRDDQTAYEDRELDGCVQDVDEGGEPAASAGPQIVSPVDTPIPLLMSSMGKLVVDMDATDPDGGPEPITFSISGEDADFFDFDPATVEISAPDGVQLVDFKDNVPVPLVFSDDGDSVFEVTVTASHGLETDTMDLQLPLFVAR